jgi:hypothetical protein
MRENTAREAAEQQITNMQQSPRFLMDSVYVFVFFTSKSIRFRIRAAFPLGEVWGQIAHCWIGPEQSLEDASFVPNSVPAASGGFRSGVPHMCQNL